MCSDPFLRLTGSALPASAAPALPSPQDFSLSFHSFPACPSSTDSIRHWWLCSPKADGHSSTFGLFFLHPPPSHAPRKVVNVYYPSLVEERACAMQKLFRRNVINVLLCVGIILSGIKKKKKGGDKKGRDKSWRAPVCRRMQLITVDSYSLCWIFRQVKPSRCWITARLSGTGRLFPEAGLTKGGGGAEGWGRASTDCWLRGKYFVRKFFLRFGRRRVGAVAFCWEIVNWLISSPAPLYPPPPPAFQTRPGSRKVGGMYKNTSWAKEIAPVLGRLPKCRP